MCAKLVDDNFQDQLLFSPSSENANQEKDDEDAMVVLAFTRQLLKPF